MNKALNIIILPILFLTFALVLSNHFKLRELETRVDKLGRLKPKTSPHKLSKYKSIELIEDFDVEPDIESSMNLSRSMLKEEMGSLSNMLRQAKAIREIDEKGNVVGFKLMQVSPDSMYEKLGLKNNDVIMAVNGFSVTSPNRAMRLFSKLKHENKIVVSLLRQNKNVQITYEIE